MGWRRRGRGERREGGRCGGIRGGEGEEEEEREEEVEKKPNWDFAKALVSSAKTLLPHFSSSGYRVSTNNLSDFLGTEMNYLLWLDFSNGKKGTAPNPCPFKYDFSENFQVSKISHWLLSTCAFKCVPHLGDPDHCPVETWLSPVPDWDASLSAAFSWNAVFHQKSPLSSSL